MLQAKIISSLEKVMPNSTFDCFEEVKEITAAKGERVSFQIPVFNPIESTRHRVVKFDVSLRSKLSKFINISKVGYVPSMMPVYLERYSGEYISTEPGYFPDVLYPVKNKKGIETNLYLPTTLWFTIELPKDIEADKYPVCITIEDPKAESNVKIKLRVVINVKNVVMPKNDLCFTQWFHCDSIADYFGVKMMSSRHWQLIERFIKVGAHTGFTMILTPLFTPPLDTGVGCERPTMQLVGIEKKGDKYEFDFSLLDKWVDICHKYGIEKFEMSHLFTQWGVGFCPKIVVKVDGKDEKLFGWHVASDSELYYNFLSQFLPALTAHLKELGIDKNCYFHISDEPSAAHYENYLKAKNFVTKYLKGFKIMDALSNIEFYDNGLIEYPVCATNHIEPFMERDIKERWCYYCCSQGELVANRFMAMPSYRNRVIGIQLYMNDMYGFLQWGYNFYYSRHAKFKVDPYAVTDAAQAFPSGDAFSVYPYENGAIESLRTVVFYEAIQDRMLLKALEAKIGKEAVKKMVRDIAGCEVNFKECLDAKTVTKIHDTVIDML